MASELLSPGTVFATRMAAALEVDELGDTERAMFTFLAGIHDLGKVNHGFQTKILPPKERGAWTQRGHVKVLLDSARVPAVRAVVGEVMSLLPLSPPDAHDLFLTTIAHYGGQRQFRAGAPVDFECGSRPASGHGVYPPGC